MYSFSCLFSRNFCTAKNGSSHTGFGCTDVPTLHDHEFWMCVRVWHFEAWTKRPTFFRKKIMETCFFFFFFFYYNFTKVRPKFSDSQWISINSGNGLCGDRQVAIAWTHDDQVWRIHACWIYIFFILVPGCWLVGGGVKHLNKIWWLCPVPTPTTRFASDVGFRMAKNLIGLYKEILLWTMASNSLKENEDIPSQILKTIFGLLASVIFRPQYVWFLVHL